MPTYPNQFIGPTPRFLRLAESTFWGLAGFLVSIILFSTVEIPSRLPAYSAWAIFTVPIVGSAVVGWVRSRDSARRDWEKLPAHWKPDPIELDSDHIAFDALDSLNTAAPKAHITIPLSRVENVARNSNGTWVSGWKHAEWMTDAWRAYIGSHPEVAKRHPTTQGRYVFEHIEAIIGRKPDSIPIEDRGGIFVLNPENGKRLKDMWEAWRALNKPLGSSASPPPRTE